MKPRFLAVACAALPALTGCLEGETVFTPGCSPTPVQQVSQQGDTIITSSGLRYIDLTIGDGATAMACGEVGVIYAGYLVDSNEPFDSGSFSFTPGAHQVIAGFEQGVVGMRVNGERRLIIPPTIGYGAQPQYNQAGEEIIPANSTLVFDIELLSAEMPPD